MTPLDAHSSDTFALKVHGDSMEPRFHEGDIVIVDPRKSAKPGSFVVARNADRMATLKMYAARGTDDKGRDIFELRPLNLAHAVMYSDREPIDILGVVVERIERFT